MEETEPGAIPIDSEILEQFKNDEFRNSPGGPAQEEVSFSGLQKAASYLLKTADDALGGYTETLGGTPEEVEKVKWADGTRKHVSELSVLVGKRNIPDDVLRKSPELILGSIILGKCVTVGLVFSQINERVDQKDESEKTEDDE